MLWHQDTAKPLSDRISRHYCDMAKLIGHNARAYAPGNPELLGQVAHHKPVFFKAASANYDQTKPEALRLMPDEGLDVILNVIGSFSFPGRR